MRKQETSPITIPTPKFDKISYHMLHKTIHMHSATGLMLYHGINTVMPIVTHCAAKIFLPLKYQLSFDFAIQIPTL